jgi:hypothetical protein
MTTWNHIENIVTLIVTGAPILGLYWMGAGLHCFWALAILLNISSVSVEKTKAMLELKRQHERASGAD